MKNKFLKFLAVVFACVSIFAFATACGDGNKESLQFQKIAGKEEYRVVGIGNVSDLDVVIPSTYCGLPVTEIGEGAFDKQSFSGCVNLTSIEIPDSITSIGYEAFYGCKNLTSIEIPDSVNSIRTSAFQGCDNLTIYCEAESKPSGWDSSWNSDNRPVKWGYKG